MFGLSLLALLVPGILFLTGIAPAAAGTAWSFLPMALTLLLLLFTRDVYPSLFLGILSAVLLLGGYQPERSFSVAFSTLTESVGTGENLAMLVTLVFYAMLMMLVRHADGTRAFAEAAGRRCRRGSTALLFTALFGAVFFFDDYFSPIAAGGIFRPLTDRHRVSREKLAFVLDTMAAPLCILIPLTSWAANVTVHTGESIFNQTIPFNYYAILILLIMLVSILLRIDLGPMKRAEEAALHDAPSVGDKFSAEEGETDVVIVKRRGKVIDFILPMVMLTVFTVGAFFATGHVGQTASVLSEGSSITAWGGVFRNAETGDLLTLPAGTTLTVPQDIVYFEKGEGHHLPITDAAGGRDAVLLDARGTALVPMENVAFSCPGADYTTHTVGLGEALILAQPAVALAIGTGAALLFTLIFYILRGIFNFTECMALLPQGLRQIAPLLLILSLSWIFGDLLGTSRLGMGDFLGDRIGALTLGGLTPLVLFIGAAALALFCGSSYATFAVFLPIATALATGGGDGAALAVSAVLSGAVLGDQASPVSDTTILSSAGAEIGVWRHVVTQIPYVAVAFFCSAAGYLVGGISNNGLAGLSAAIGILAALLLLYILTRIHRNRRKNEP